MTESVQKSVCVQVSKYLRLVHLKWSQAEGRFLQYQEMAARLDTPLASLMRWINGVRPPDLSNTLKIAAALKSPEIIRITAPLYGVADPDALYIASVWGKLSQEEKDEIIAKVKSLTEPLTLENPTNHINFAT